MPVDAHLLCRTALAAAAGLSLDVGATALDACLEIEADAARLACYDKVSGRTKVSPDRPPTTDTAALSPMQKAWGTVGDTGHLFAIRPYKPVYLFPVFHTNHINNTPHSPRQVTDHQNGLTGTEAKFQLSLKTQLASNLFGDNGDLWAGYTQSSRWQVYAEGISRPFRESNYEPEAMFVWKTNRNILGFRMPFASIGINHQSNGQSDPLSRSWNRVIGQVGFERDDWTATVRLWHRIKEKRENDDNPDMVKYAGRGDLLVTRAIGGHRLTALIRPPLATGEQGALRLDWAFPLSGQLKGHLQWFTGYGESLIDYNHRAQYFGVGVSLVEWY